MREVEACPAFKDCLDTLVLQVGINLDDLLEQRGIVNLKVTAAFERQPVPDLPVEASTTEPYEVVALVPGATRPAL